MLLSKYNVNGLFHIRIKQRKWGIVEERGVREWGVTMLYSMIFIYKLFRVNS